MKKLMFLLIMFLFIDFLSAKVIINEIELNPKGKDGGFEWIELYSKDEVDLTNWKLINNDGDVIDLDQNFKGYLIIEFEKQWLDNSDEKVMLVDENNNKIFETEILKDSTNDDKTNTYCEDDGEFIFIDSTKNSENDCYLEIIFEEDEENEEEFEDIVEESRSIPEINNENGKIENNVFEQPKSNEVIQLTNVNTYVTSSEPIKTNNNILYQSKNELLKKYLIYGFAIFCVFLCVLLALNKLN